MYYPNATSRKRGYRRYSIQWPGTVCYYIAFFALQAFLILLKQNKYGTDAGENSLTIQGSLSAFMGNSNSPVWPPVGLEPDENI